MRSKLLIGGLAAALAFLLATNPLVAQAAGFITSADIVNNTIKSKDVKNNGVKSKDIKNNNLTGSDVRDGSLTGADVADSSLTGTDLADGSLNGGDLMVRVASATDDDAAVFGTTGATPALTTSIVAPVRGFLVMSGGSDVSDGTSNTFADCWITLNGTAQDPSSRTIELNVASNREENCETSITVAVNAGTHQVDLTANPFETTTLFDESTLQVVFVPFGGTGATPPKPSALGGAAGGNN